MLQRTEMIQPTMLQQTEILQRTMLQRTEMIQQTMLQRTEMIQRTMLQRTVFINKIRMLQRKRRNNIGRSNTRVRMTCLVFPIWLERQSSSLLSCVRFSYQFSSVICLFVQWIKVGLISFILILHIFFILYYMLLVQMVVLDGNFALDCGPRRFTPKYIYFNVR